MRMMILVGVALFAIFMSQCLLWHSKKTTRFLPFTAGQTMCVMGAIFFVTLWCVIQVIAAFQALDGPDFWEGVPHVWSWNSGGAFGQRVPQSLASSRPTNLEVFPMEHFSS